MSSSSSATPNPTTAPQVNVDDDWGMDSDSSPTPSPAAAVAPKAPKTPEVPAVVAPKAPKVSEAPKAPNAAVAKALRKNKEARLAKAAKAVDTAKLNESDDESDDESESDEPTAPVKKVEKVEKVKKTKKTKKAKKVVPDTDDDDVVPETDSESDDVKVVSSKKADPADALVSDEEVDDSDSDEEDDDDDIVMDDSDSDDEEFDPSAASAATAAAAASDTEDEEGDEEEEDEPSVTFSDDRSLNAEVKDAARTIMETRRCLYLHREGVPLIPTGHFEHSKSKHLPVEMLHDAIFLDSTSQRPSTKAIYMYTPDKNGSDESKFLFYAVWVIDANNIKKGYLLPVKFQEQMSRYYMTLTRTAISKKWRAKGKTSKVKNQDVLVYLKNRDNRGKARKSGVTLPIISDLQFHRMMHKELNAPPHKHLPRRFICKGYVVPAGKRSRSSSPSKRSRNSKKSRVADVAEEMGRIGKSSSPAFASVLKPSPVRGKGKASKTRPGTVHAWYMARRPAGTLAAKLKNPVEKVLNQAFKAIHEISNVVSTRCMRGVKTAEDAVKRFGKVSWPASIGAREILSGGGSDKDYRRALIFLMGHHGNFVQEALDLIAMTPDPVVEEEEEEDDCDMF